MPLQVQDSDKTKSEVHGSVRAWFKVKNSNKIRREVHTSPLQVQDCDNTKLEVHGLFKKRLKRQDKERGASVPLWMQENDEPK